VPGAGRLPQQDHRLLERIREGSGRTYGSPRVTSELRAAGVRCSRKRVARLMRQAGADLVYVPTQEGVLDVWSRAVVGCARMPERSWWWLLPAPPLRTPAGRSCGFVRASCPARRPPADVRSTGPDKQNRFDTPVAIL